MDTARTIREEEGTRLEVYEDSLGNLTVGIGHKVIIADQLQYLDVISEKRCLKLFMADLKRAEKGALAIYCDMGGHSGSIALHVLTCMVFQMGEAGVRKFKKMLAALAINDYIEAAAEMLRSKWAIEDTPERAQRLADVMRGKPL